MDVVQTSQQRQTGVNSAETEQNTGAITSDFETFLAMLTAQMENQDPLNPMESTDFATQLATFSGVEQQVLTNDLLGDLQTSMNLMNMGQLTGWVGMEARAEMPAAFAGTPLTLAGTPHAQADRMELVVTDQNGNTVHRETLPLSDESFTWAGVGADGTPLAEGTYTFATHSYSGDTLLEERPAQVYAEIEEAVLRDGQTWLTMAGGVTIPADAVQGIRNP